MKNKNLGQHFLKNKSAVKKIIAALDLKPNDTIIEIGPGEGALTFPLLEKCKKVGCRLIAIEKDPQLGSRVKGLGNSKNLKFIIGDALKEIPKITKLPTLNPIPYKIVGNIPYYITGKLLRVLGELITNYQLPITDIVLMIQKEVAERITAKPPHNNLLAAAVQFWSEPEILFTLKPGDFDPPPKVNSAVIRLTTNNEQPTKEFSKKYYALLHVLFKQPRKTVSNNLKTGHESSKTKIENHLKALNIDPISRPQNLTLEQIKGLIDFIKQ